jgi:hypothetical protein
MLTVAEPDDPAKVDVTVQFSTVEVAVTTPTEETDAVHPPLSDHVDPPTEDEYCCEPSVGMVADTGVTVMLVTAPVVSCGLSGPRAILMVM